MKNKSFAGKDKKTNTFVWSEVEDVICPQCGNSAFILRTDEKITITHDMRQKNWDVETPRNRVISFKLYCSQCGQDQVVTDGLLDAIDFYLS
ncbi:MAG: hypothetical protein ACP5VS_17750 [Desulfomonilaceae bacterium]